MGLSTLDGEIQHRGGTFTFGGSVALPVESIGNAQVSSASPLATNKVRHRHHKTYEQANGTATATDQRVVHVAYGAAGSIIAARAGILTAGSGGGMSVTVDIKKNGTSVLTSVVTLDATTVSLALATALVSVTAFVAGDVFEVVVTATAGGGTLPQGLFVDILFDEDAV